MTLVIASLVSVMLLSLHLAHDIVLGMSPGGLTNIVALLIGGVYLYGTLALPARRAGLIIMLVGAIAAVGVSIIHMTHRGLTGPRSTAGGLLFVWTVLALGMNGLFCVVLAARELWATRSRASLEPKA